MESNRAKHASNVAVANARAATYYAPSVVTSVAPGTVYAGNLAVADPAYYSYDGLYGAYGTDPYVSGWSYATPWSSYWP